MFQPAIIELKVLQNITSSAKIMKSGLEIETSVYDSHDDKPDKVLNQHGLLRHSVAHKQSISSDVIPRESEAVSKLHVDYGYEEYMKRQVLPDGSLVFSLGNLETLIVLSTAVLFIFCLSLNAPTSTYPAIAAFQIVIYDFSKH